MALVLSGTDNSVSSPSVQGSTGGTTSGVYYPASNQVAISTNSTQAILVDSSQNVGIGTSPSTKLDVNGPSGNTSFTGTNAMAITVRGSTSSTDYSAIDFRSSAASSGSTAIGRIGVVAGGAGSSMSFGTSNSYVSGITNTAMTINPSGNLGIGTSSPSQKLHVQGAGNTYLRIQDTQAGGYNAANLYANDERTFRVGVLGTAGGFANGYFVVYDETAGAWRMLIDNNGNLLVGTTTSSGNSSTFKSTSAGAQACSFWNSATSGTRYFTSFATEATSTDRGYITYNGTIVAIAQASDVRLKKNIIDAPSALEKIAAVQIRSFDFIENNQHVDYGVIAQELNQVVPAAVFEGSDNEDGTINKPWAVGLEPLIPILTKAIQEQQAIIEQLKADVAALKAQK